MSAGSSLIDVMNVKKDGNLELDENNARKQDRTGQVSADLSRISEFDDTTQSSTPLNTVVQPQTRKALEAAVDASLPVQPEVTEEVEQILRETNEDGTLYRYPRHFAQLGNRQGFTLFIGTQDSDGPSTLEITFEKGVFSSNDVRLVSAIHTAINRKTHNVRSQIREISASHYDSIVRQGLAYQNLKGVGAMVSSADTKVNGGKAPSVLEAENNSLREQLAAMQAQVASITKAVDKDAETTSMFTKS